MLLVVCLLHDVRLMNVFFTVFASVICICRLFYLEICSLIRPLQKSLQQIALTQENHTKESIDFTESLLMYMPLRLRLEEETIIITFNGPYILLCKGCIDVFVEDLYRRFTH